MDRFPGSPREHHLLYTVASKTRLVPSVDERMRTGQGGNTRDLLFSTGKKEHRERMAAKDEAERQKALEKEAAAAAEEDVKMSKPKPQKKKKNKNKGGQKSEGPAPMQE
eukprot:133467-Pelagomonas_calceolata.AAC.1